MRINPLNAELNPICHLLPLLGTHHILNVGRIRVKLDNTINYSRTSTEKKRFLLFLNTTRNPCVLPTLKHVEKFKLHDLKKKLHINLHEELRSHFLYIAKSIQTIVCLHLSFIVYKLLYKLGTEFLSLG